MSTILYGKQPKADKDYFFTLSGDNDECVQQCQQLADLYDISFDGVYDSWMGASGYEWHEFYVILLSRGLFDHELNWLSEDKPL